MHAFLNILGDKKILRFFVLFFIPFLLYYSTLKFGFSPMDEQWLIVTNTKALEGFKSIGTSFQTSILNVYFRPLLLSSFVIDYNLHALAPKAYHLTNVLLHCACVLLLFQVLLKSKVEKKIAVVLALLFALHPMAVHAVAWVPGRNDSLLSLFFLCACLLLLQYFETKKIIFLVLHLIAVMAAFFTKESALVLPLAFAILLYKREKKEIFLFVGLWLAAVVIWLFVKQSVPLKPLYSNSNLVSALLDVCSAFVFNAGKLIVPLYQSVSPIVKGPQLWISIVALLTASFVLLKSKFKEKNFAVFGLALLVLGFAPVLWFSAHTPLQEQYEHRAYLPLIGLLLIVAQSKLLSSKFFAGLLLFLLPVYAFKTVLRISTYSTELSFLQEGAKDCADNYMLQTKLGNYYMLKKMYPEALSYFDIAVKRQPEKAQLLNSRANVYVELGMKNEAIADYTKALQFSNYNYSVYMARCWAFWKFKDVNNAFRDMEGIKNRYPGQMDPQLETEIRKAWLAELSNKQKQH